MQHAIDKYMNAATFIDLSLAYDELIEAYAADASLPDDVDFASGVDALLNSRGLPDFRQRMDEIEANDIY